MILGIHKVKATTEEPIIQDGIYTIASSMNSQLVLTVKNAQQNPMANVEIATKQNLQNQKFQITHLADGYYKMEVLHSGKVLDVYAGSQQNGANVDQYNWNNTDAQKWKIVDAGNGKYAFISKCNNLYLDVYAGLQKSGTNIQTYASNQTNSQKFTLEKVTSPVGKKTIEDGLYTIHMKKNHNTVLQVLQGAKTNGATMGVWQYQASAAQKFFITYQQDGYYQIKSAYSGKVLDVYAALRYDGAKVDQYDWNNTDAQKWIIQDLENGAYAIISKCNNLYLDIYGGDTVNGTKAHMYSGNGSQAQQFQFQKAEEVKPVKSIKDGVYLIKPSYNDAKVLDIEGGSRQNFVNLQLYDNVCAQNQKFHVEEIQNTGYYKIIAVDSGKVLDVYAGNQENGTNVDQYDWNNTDAQKWIIKDAGNGTYSVISKCNELALDIVGGYSHNGTNVQMYMANNSKAQKFVFEPVQIYPNGEYELETKLHANQVIDISGGNMQNAVKAQVWEASNVPQQKFAITYKGDGTYTVKAQHSSKMLTVGQDGSIYQYDYIGEPGQRWVIREAGDGYYYLVSKLNNQYLTIGNVNNGSMVYGTTTGGKDTQKFKFFNGVRTYFEEGTYGKSGLAIIGDKRGRYLRYYKFGKGSNVLFATFSIHGFEDSYYHDGSELTYIAEEFKKYLTNLRDASIFNNWTIYIFPDVNPDGQTYGWTHNGPGRTSLVSSAPTRAGIDLNRNWQPTGETYVRYSGERNYNGTAGFQGYEARALRDFLLTHKSAYGQTLLVDLHGWLNETIGDNGLGKYYQNQYHLPTHISSYGRGYLIDWARKSLGGTKVARSVLVELPQVYNHTQLVNQQFTQKYILATMQMLREIGR